MSIIFDVDPATARRTREKIAGEPEGRATKTGADRDKSCVLRPRRGRTDTGTGIARDRR
jgi:hypothetical protein